MAKTGKWHGELCSNKRAYICEKSREEKTTNTVAEGIEAETLKVETQIAKLKLEKMELQVKTMKETLRDQKVKSREMELEQKQREVEDGEKKLEIMIIIAIALTCFIALIVFVICLVKKLKRSLDKSKVNPDLVYQTTDQPLYPGVHIDQPIGVGVPVMLEEGAVPEGNPI